VMKPNHMIQSQPNSKIRSKLSQDDRPKVRSPIRILCHVTSSENNCHLCMRYLDPKTAQVKQRSGSTGLLGFQKSKRSTAYASEELIRKMFNQLHREVKEEEHRVRIDLVFSGYGQGRVSMVKMRLQLGFPVRSLSDATPLAHNGCRPKKPRRV